MTISRHSRCCVCTPQRSTSISNLLYTRGVCRFHLCLLLRGHKVLMDLQKRMPLCHCEMKVLGKAHFKGISLGLASSLATMVQGSYSLRLTRQTMRHPSAPPETRACHECPSLLPEKQTNVIKTSLHKYDCCSLSNIQRLTTIVQEGSPSMGSQARQLTLPE